MYERILVATDGSKLSNKATAAALELSFSTGAEMIVLTVVPRYPTSYFEGGLSLSNSDIGHIEGVWHAKGQATVDKIVQAAKTQGIKAKGIVYKSDLIAETITKIAQKSKCDLIVMASHGRKGIRRLLLGSETLHVLTHGNLPVLVLR